MASKNNKDRQIIYPPEKEQKKFLKFLFWYSTIDDITSNELLNTIYKNLPKTLRKKLPNGSIVLCKRKELEEMTSFDFSSDRIYCTRWNNCSQPIAFLRHLRNSIAHGKIRLSGKKWLIYDEDSNGTMTAKGEINTSTLKSIFTEIITS